MSSGNKEYEAAQEIFLSVLDLDPGERKEYLNDACGDNALLREMLEVLLEEYDEGSETLAIDGGAFGPEPAGGPRFVPGDVLANRYRIVVLLGKGGMGEVYRADDLKLEQPVALKLLPADLADNPRLRKALYNEVRLARRVSDRHVCRVYDIGEADGLHFLSMEFIEGEDLASLLRRIGRLPADKAIELGRQLCRGLQAAHEEGLLHLDLKPGNLMIDSRGVLRITDFGLSRLTSETDGQRSRAGTPAYMAPEQILRGVVSEQCDIYAVGMVLFEMLTGQRVHLGRDYGSIIEWHRRREPVPPPSRHAGGLDPALDRLILQCLDPEPGLRPPSSARVVDGLTAVSGAPEVASDGIETATQDAPSTGDLETSDVIIAYAPVDNRPLIPGRRGWISQFHRNLEVRLEQLSGEPVKVWRDTVPLDESRLGEIVPLLPKVKTMVSIVSPPFVKDSSCVREVAEYWRAVEPEGEGAGTRLFKAVKTPVHAEDVPPEVAVPFSRVAGFDFYEIDPETARVREFDESFGELAKQRYFERIYDVAFEVCRALRNRGEESSDGSPRDGKVVYLAETSSELQPVRDQLRRELQERGHRVVPDQPLPWRCEEFSGKVREYLAGADLAIHLVGNRYGVIPEDTDHSIVDLQNVIAGDYCAAGGTLERVIWIPWDVHPADERQEAFLNDLTNDPKSHLGGEVIRDTFPNLKGLVLDKLKPANPRQVEADPPVPDGAAQTSRIVYLLCDRRDEEAIEPLEDFLIDCGFAVQTPHFEGSISEIGRLHREQLVSCDGVLVYYGAASKAWVETNLTDVLRAPGYGREKPMRAQAVYVAPPEDRRKARFRTSLAEVLRQDGAGFQAGLLSGFTAKLNEGRPNGD